MGDQVRKRTGFWRSGDTEKMVIHDGGQYITYWFPKNEASSNREACHGTLVEARRVKLGWRTTDFLIDVSSHSSF